jgi:hypothetical protein
LQKRKHISVTNPKSDKDNKPLEALPQIETARDRSICAKAA